MVKKPSIRYTSRDFDSIKEDLVNYIKRYYPDTFQDFQDAGVGSMLLDTTAYVGDILSFYLDYQVNESFLDTASEFENIIKIAKQMGYRYKPNKTSSGVVAFYVEVPAQLSMDFESSAKPNLNYTPILRKGTSLSSSNGVPFILATDVDFTDSSNEILVSKTNSSTGRPEKYVIKAYGRVISGRLQRATKVLGAYKPFQKVQINNNSISEIISVIDSQGNEYYEVPNLAQDTILVEVPNNGDDRNYVKFLLQPKSVPRRFQVNQFGAFMELQFGYGSEDDIETHEKKVIPSNVLMDIYGKNYISDTSFDPNVILKTGKFGIAPGPTTLTITYRANNDSNVNIPARNLNKVDNSSFKFLESATSDPIKQTVIASLRLENEEPIAGDMAVLNADEIRVLAMNSRFAQNRAVTAEDYRSLVYNMPEKFGGIKKCVAYKDSRSLKNNINIYTLTENQNGKLIAPPSALKNNLKTWLNRHKILSDSIDIFDGKVINLKIDFIAVAEDGQDKTAVYARAKNAIINYLRLNPNNIGDSFFVTKITNVINETRGVADVVRITARRKTGDNYSSTFFNTLANTSADGRKVFIPKNAIWEIRFPSSDINGEVR
jgi:hypothetical protein